MYDYSIIGGGLAGTTLANRLILQGAKVMVFDCPTQNRSSSVAAGIFNPITGKRMALTWQATEMFGELHSYYTKMEHTLGETFFYPMPFYKIFESVFDQNEWLTKLQVVGLEHFMKNEVQNLNPKKVANSFGAMQILKAGRLNSRLYLESMHRWLRDKKAFTEHLLDYTKIKLSNDWVSCDGIKSHAIIFCDGSQARANPYFNYLPHKPVHGELLEVEIPDFYKDRIVNKGVFIVPLPTDRYLVGATYNWDLEEAILTENGQLELETKLQEIVGLNYTIVGHYAGIRPSTKDRRPYIGSHPKFKNVFNFGGFGSKGVSLIPYLSKVFMNYLLNDADLPSEVDICRVK